MSITYFEVSNIKLRQTAVWIEGLICEQVCDEYSIINENLSESYMEAH